MCNYDSNHRRSNKSVVTDLIVDSIPDMKGKRIALIADINNYDMDSLARNAKIDRTTRIDCYNNLSGGKGTKEEKGRYYVSHWRKQLDSLLGEGYFSEKCRVGFFNMLDAPYEVKYDFIYADTCNMYSQKHGDFINRSLEQLLEKNGVIIMNCTLNRYNVDDTMKCAPKTGMKNRVAFYGLNDVKYEQNCKEKIAKISNDIMASWDKKQKKSYFLNQTIVYCDDVRSPMGVLDFRRK